MINSHNTFTKKFLLLNIVSKIILSLDQNKCKNSFTRLKFYHKYSIS